MDNFKSIDAAARKLIQKKYSAVSLIEWLRSDECDAFDAATNEALLQSSMRTVLQNNKNPNTLNQWPISQIAKCLSLWE